MSRAVFGVEELLLEAPKAFWQSAALLTAVAVSVAGCGGGGGGGAAGNNSGGGGSANGSGALGVTKDNMYGLAAFPMYVAENLYLIDGDIIDPALDAYFSNDHGVTRPCPTAGSFTTAYVDDGNGIFSAGDTITRAYAACDSVDGQLRLVVTSFADDGQTVTLGANLDYNLAFDAGYGYAGSHSLVYVDSGASSLLSTTGGRFEYTETGISENVSGFASTYSFDADGGYRIEISGSVVSQYFGGRYSFRTEVPLEGAYGRLPSSGALVATGNASSAILTPQNIVPYVLLSLDVSGGSSSDYELGLSWFDLVYGSLFGVDPDNQAPAITSVTISPQHPMEGDDLHAVVAASDPEDDDLAYRYEWRRNDIIDSAVTTSVYPASAHSVDDRIFVQVFVDDGVSTTEQTTAVYIEPLALKVSSATPTVEAAYGQPVNFSVSVTNLNGSPVPSAPPVQYELLHGPAGMSIDAVTGIASWTPHGPMFDREADIYWSVRSDDATVLPGGGSIHVVDAEREYPLSRSGLEVPEAPGRLRVGDFDGDGAEELLIIGRNNLSELSWDGSDYRQSWMYPFAIEPGAYIRALASGDVDGDGAQEIFVCGGAITKLDGAERRLVASAEQPLQNACEDAAVADLTGDGSVEVVVLTRGQVAVYAADTLDLIWTSPADNLNLTMGVGNVDADAALEIVTAGGTVFDGATQSPQWVHSASFGASVGVGDVDGDGVAEIVGAGGPGQIDSVRVYRATTQSLVAEAPLVGATTVHVADIDGGPEAEIVVGPEGYGDLVTYRYDSASGSLQLLSQIAIANNGVGAIASGDVDNDGARELVWSAGTRTGYTPSFQLAVARAAAPIGIEWANPHPVLGGPFTAWLPASSVLEPSRLLSLSNFRSSRLLGMAPAGTGLTVGPEIGSSLIGSDTTSLAVSDYDNDGIEEAIAGTGVADQAYLEVVDFNAGVTEWSIVLPASSPLASRSVTRDLVPVELTGDGHPDLVALTSGGNNAVYAIDLFSQSVLWQLDFTDTAYDLEVLDIEGDGRPEIFVSVRTRLLRFSDVAGSYVQTAAVDLGSEVHDFTIGDIDGDGATDLFALAGSFGAVVRLDAGLAIIGSFDVREPVEAIEIEDLADLRKNLVLAISGPGDARGYVAVIDPRTGDEVSRSPALSGRLRPDGLRYVDSDGSLRLSVGSEVGALVTR